jgi:hypothetical protein
MRAFSRVLLAATLAAFTPHAFGWAADFEASSACDADDGVWIPLPDGQASLYADGADGGGTLSFVFQLVDGETTAGDIIDPALSYTSDGTGGIVPIGLGAGWKVCARLANATAPDMHVEIHPMYTRTVDGNLKERY